MFPQSTVCLACQKRWATMPVHSEYERLARESCPCPACGAYALSCVTPPRAKKPRREAARR